jgi:integrase
MASIHKRPGRPYWFCAFTTPDGVRRFRSTKTSDKKTAWQVCQAWDKATKTATKGRLSPEKAREIISRGVADIYEITATEDLPNSSFKLWAEEWIQKKTLELSEGSHYRYNRAIKDFAESLGSKASRDMAIIEPRDVGKWRDQIFKRLTSSSANVALKIVRACFNDAKKQQLISNNPASLVGTLKRADEKIRRALTIQEIKRLLDVAKDSEWKGLILFGLYTGQRLGDIRKLTWKVIDTEKWEMRIVTQKTKRRMIIPLIKPIQDYLLSLPSQDEPNALIFPRFGAVKESGSVSNRFRELLEEAGLVPIRPANQGKGKLAKRTVSEISFHSLRHSAVTFLKASGVNDSLAREIVGHDSAEVNQHYTHLSSEDMRNALEKMKDVTK